MKILFLFPRINEYKNFKPLINISNHLIKNSYEVYIASASPPTLQTLNNYNTKINFIIKKNNQSKFSWIKSLLDKDFDLSIGVQAHNGMLLSICKLSKIKYWTKKIISWEHSSPITSLKSEYKNFWPIWISLRWILSFNTDKYICVSKGAKREMEKILTLQNKKKALHIPNMIYETLPNYKEQRNKKIIFLSIGRLAPEKGIIIALKALSKLENIDFEYIIAGDGPCRRELEIFCENDSILNKRVRFLGYCDNVNEIMQGSDILLLPSYFEGLPTVLVEACINNLPIIASDCHTGPSEIVAHGTNGYLFQVGNSSDLLEKIKEWIQNKEVIKNSSNFANEYGEEAGIKFINELQGI